MARRRMRKLGPRSWVWKIMMSDEGTNPEVARKNSMARHALAYSWVTTDAAGHRWVHIRPIH